MRILLRTQRCLFLLSCCHQSKIKERYCSLDNGFPAYSLVVLPVTPLPRILTLLRVHLLMTLTPHGPDSGRQSCCVNSCHISSVRVRVVCGPLAFHTLPSAASKCPPLLRGSKHVNYFLLDSIWQVNLLGVSLVVIIII